MQHICAMWFAHVRNTEDTRRRTGSAMFSRSLLRLEVALVRIGEKVREVCEPWSLSFTRRLEF